MSVENPLWGAPRIHGELLKLGFAQSSAAKYMVKRRRPPSQGWRTFLRNHAADIAAMDSFVVPIIGFDLLHAFVIVGLQRRSIVWINVTANPTAEWVARQVTEAFPWNDTPRHMIRDRQEQDRTNAGASAANRPPACSLATIVGDRGNADELGNGLKACPKRRVVGCCPDRINFRSFVWPSGRNATPNATRSVLHSLADL
jgi:hypothetical protein